MLLAVIASLAVADNRTAAGAEMWLEDALRSRFPRIESWGIRPLEYSVKEAELTSERYELGRVGARTLVLVHGRDARGRPVLQQRWFQVSGMVSVVVVNRSVGAKTKLSAEMLDVQSVDLMAQSCTPLTDPAQALGFRLLQARREGETLCASMLGRMPAVQRGSTVSVSVTVGRVALRTEAVARSDADVGERVSLYRESDRELFSGVVNAPGEVEIK